MPRPTDDKKESKIILRINNETRIALENLSSEKNISISEYVRKTLKDVIVNNTSKITKPITIRVKNECAAYFEGKPLNRMVESLMEYIEMGQIEEVEGKLVVKGAFMVDKAIVTDLGLMCELYGITFDEMFEELHRAIDEGEIDVVEGHFKYLKA